MTIPGTRPRRSILMPTHETDRQVRAAVRPRLSGNGLPRGFAAILVVALVGPVASMRLPAAQPKRPLLICSFERPEDLQIVRPAGGTRAERVPMHATHGRYSLKCAFPGNEKDTWPGLSWKVPPDLRVSDFDVLEIDVYNPAAKSVHFSWRIDDAAGRKVFGGTSLRPRSTTTVDIPVKRRTGPPEARRIVHIYPYISKPRKDVTLFLDNFRLAYFYQRFTALVYEEQGPFAQPDATDRKRGAMVFHRHWMDFVFPVSRPRPGERNPTLRAAAARGETEPLTVSIRALRALSGVRAHLSDLRTPQGAVIPASAGSVYVMRCLNKRVTYSSRQYIRDLPVYLSRQPAVDVPAARTQTFWIDVRVPEDAAPGLYTGNVRLTARSGLEPVDVPVRLRVWPFRLDEADRILGDYYQTPRPAVTDKEKHALLEHDLRDMRRRGATSVGLCFGCPVDNAVLRPDGTVELNLPEDCLYVHFMNLYRDLGFPMPVVQLADSGQAFAAARELTFGTPRYAAAYKAFWKAMQAEARKRGWPEIIVQPVDEPGWKDDEARRRNVELLKLLKQIPGQRTEQDGPGDHYFHDIAGPWADVWNYNGTLGPDDRLKAARKQGRLIMIYNCDVESWRPEMDRYVNGFFQELAGIHGAYNWAYISYYGSPYDDLDSKMGTWMHVYPAVDGEPGGPSTGWQGFREGVDDLRYIVTLRNAIRRARSAKSARLDSLAKQAEADLEGLLDSLQYHRRQRATGRWAAKRREGDHYVIRGPYSIPNGWSFEEYDAARRLLAFDIWRIRAALAHAPAPPIPELQGAPAVAFQFDQFTQAWTMSNRAAEKRMQTFPFVSIPVIAHANVEIDGRTGDPDWKRAAIIPALVRTADGSPADAGTRVRLLADSANLYVAFECSEPKIGQITATIDKDGAAVWKDDCVELYVDPRGDGRTFRQIVVNCLGRQFWKASDRLGWRAHSKAAAVIDSRGQRWTVELRVPLADLGVRQGRLFGLNLCRERRPTEAFELLAWSPTGGNFARPERFGRAVIGDAAGALRTLTFGLPMLGQQYCRALFGPSPKPIRFRLDVFVNTGRKDSRRYRGKPVTLSPGKPTWAECAYIIPIKTPRVTITATIVRLDRGKERPEISLTRTQTIAPLLGKPRITPVVAGASVQREFTIEAHAAPPAHPRPRLLLLVSRAGEDAGAPLGSTPLYLEKGGTVRGRLIPNGLPPGSYTLRIQWLTFQGGTPLQETQRSFVVTPDWF